MNGTANNITGIILAGGQSRRMGGGDKCLLPLAGKSMLQHVIDRVGPQVAKLAINANGDPARFEAFALDVFPDTIGGFAGPLAGILAGMRWSATNTPSAEWIATVSADAPFLPSDLIRRLHQEATAHPGAIALAGSDGNAHPVIGLWPVAHADDLESALNDGVRKVLHWTDRHGTLIVEFPSIAIGGKMIDPFFNANTPDDLKQAETLLLTG